MLSDGRSNNMSYDVNVLCFSMAGGCQGAGHHSFDLTDPVSHPGGPAHPVGVL